MTTTATDLLQAILLNPADTTLRLVYADQLDEDGERERAEFIKIQLELASGDHRFGPACGSGTVEDRLRRRERELLQQHARDWLSPSPTGFSVIRSAPDQIGWALDGAANQLGRWYIPVEFRRGFPEVITCRLADWFGGECPTCPGSESLCYRCNGTGRTPGHGPAIVQAAPVVEVRVTDREPQDYHNNTQFQPSNPRWYGWWREVNGQYGLPYNLPPTLWDLLPKDGGREDHGQWADWISPEPAKAALSAALVRWARREAGLET